MLATCVPSLTNTACKQAVPPDAGARRRLAANDQVSGNVSTSTWFIKVKNGVPLA